MREGLPRLVRFGGSFSFALPSFNLVLALERLQGHQAQRGGSWGQLQARYSLVSVQQLCGRSGKRLADKRVGLQEMLTPALHRKQNRLERLPKGR